MCEKIAVELGFDKKKGRLDVSVHPFTGEYKYMYVNIYVYVCVNIPFTGKYMSV